MPLTIAVSLMPYIINFLYSMSDEEQEPAASVAIAEHLKLYQKMFGIILVDSSAPSTPKDLIKLHEAVTMLADRFDLWGTCSSGLVENWMINLEWLVKDLEQAHADEFIRRHAPQLLAAGVPRDDLNELVHAVYLGRLQQKVLRRNAGAVTRKSAQLGRMVNADLQHLIDTNAQVKGWDQLLFDLINNGQRI